MSYNTKLMYIQMPPRPPRRPAMPATTSNSSPLRTLGTSRGGGMSKSGNFASSRREGKREENGATGRPSLSLKDITKFDLMSPYAVQQLTGSFKSSFPTVSGKETCNLKMVKIQLPKSPYTTLPRLALTKGEDIREEARTNLTRGLSRSHSELSHYRTRDSHRALMDRPHTESRLTRRAQHGGPAVFSSRASTISEESRLPQESETSSSSSETSRKESERNHFRFEEPAQQSDRSSTIKELAQIQRAKLRSHTRTAAWGKHGKGTAKTGRANTADKMANLGMSEYTEVHATNRQMRGQVWSGVKPKSSPDGSRLVRFNTHNDVFEYTPGQCLKGNPSPITSHAE